MANFYWRGQTGAELPSLDYGTTYDKWISATSITASNFVKFSGYGSVVHGPTMLPGINDYVYFREVYPIPGTTWNNRISNMSSVHSPCLNSTGVTLSASVIQIGPFNNQTTVPLPLAGVSACSARVGGGVLGNAGVAETVNFSGATLTGQPLKTNAPNVTIFGSSARLPGAPYFPTDLPGAAVTLNYSGLGGYDINISGGTATNIRIINPYTQIEAPDTHYSRARSMNPWLLHSKIYITGTPRSIHSEDGSIAGHLVIGSGTDMSGSSLLGLSGASAGYSGSFVAPIQLYGQFDSVKIEKNANVGAVTVRPGYLINDAGTGMVAEYHFAGSIPPRGGLYDGILVQQNPAAATLLMQSAIRAYDISGTTASFSPQSYTVILGDHSINDESYSTSYAFITEGHQIGSPDVRLRGTIGDLSDFDLHAGSLSLDSTNEIGNSGVICKNGLIRSSRGVSFYGNALNGDLQVWNIAQSNAGFGLRIVGAVSSGQTKFPGYHNNSTPIQSLITSTIPIPPPDSMAGSDADGNDQSGLELSEEIVGNISSLLKTPSWTYNSKLTQDGMILE